VSARIVLAPRLLEALETLATFGRVERTLADWRLPSPAGAR
jgi:hypothetical protein